MFFERSVELPAGIDESFAYHERPGALKRLIPPWERVSIKRSDESLAAGSEVLLQTQIGPIPLHWLARHEQYNPPKMFSDRQVKGPFSRWYHKHCFDALGEGRTKLTDRVEYELPFGRLGRFMGQSFIASKLEAMFRYRHRVSYEDLLLGQLLAKKSSEEAKQTTVAISGSHGLIGDGIVSLLSVLGYQIIRLERSSSTKDIQTAGRNRASSSHSSNTRSIVWDPVRGLADPMQLNGIDAIIHLAGKGIAEQRWTEKTKLALTRSRINATEVLANQLAALPLPPKAFVSASGIGIYGNRSQDVLEESEPPSHDFLGKLAKGWEDASSSLSDRGSRVCFGRLGIVLTPRGGALAKMLPIFRWGLGGRVGSGEQYWSWIDYQDAVSAFIWLALDPVCRGAYNLSAGAVTNTEFTKTLAKVLGRPAIVPAPAFAIRAAMGEMADGLLLNSTRASGRQLLASGYPLRQKELERALQDMLGVQAEPDSAILRV